MMYSNFCWDFRGFRARKYFFFNHHGKIFVNFVDKLYNFAQALRLNFERMRTCPFPFPWYLVSEEKVAELGEGDKNNGKHDRETAQVPAKKKQSLKDLQDLQMRSHAAGPAGPADEEPC